MLRIFENALMNNDSSAIKRAVIKLQNDISVTLNCGTTISCNSAFRDVSQISKTELKITNATNAMIKFETPKNNDINKPMIILEKITLSRSNFATTLNTLTEKTAPIISMIVRTSAIPLVLKLVIQERYKEPY